MRNLGIRARVMLLVILCAIPALALSLYMGYGSRQQAELHARANLERYATLAVERQEQLIEGVHELLFALAGRAGALLMDPPQCQAYFLRLVAASNGKYHSMGIHGSDGVLACNAVQWQGRIDVNDRRYFRLAADTGRFAIGEFQVGRATGKAGINFAYPVLDEDSVPVAVVFVGLNVGRFSEITLNSQLPPGSQLTIADVNGDVVSRNPESAGRIGERLRNPRVLAALENGMDTMFEAPDTAGNPRLFAFKGVGRNADGRPALFIVLSIPREIIFAEANMALTKTASGILLATLLLVALAWYGANDVVVRKVQAMLRMTHAVHRGDLGARTGIAPAGEELSRLGQALDEMAGALQSRDAALQRALAELREEAAIDPLTGLYNRRNLWDFLRRELQRAQRASKPVSVIMLDIDHFKYFNDTWGHAAGDAVLKRIADLVRSSVRGSDLAGRYGGEEMIVILPNATAHAALERAEAIRTEIVALHLEYAGAPLGAVTASFGIAVFPDHAANAEALVRAADETMYEAKKAGRNRVVMRNVAIPALAA